MMSEAVAKAFHEAYERLAPSFGYATRQESAVPWEAVPEQNRLLMIAVTDEVARKLETELNRLQAAISAAMRIIRDPNLVQWGANPANDGPGHGYWVKVGGKLEFVGPHLHDAINRLAAEAGKDP